MSRRSRHGLLMRTNRRALRPLFVLTVCAYASVRECAAATFIAFCASRQLPPLSLLSARLPHADATPIYATPAMPPDFRRFQAICLIAPPPSAARRPPPFRAPPPRLMPCRDFVYAATAAAAPLLCAAERASAAARYAERCRCRRRCYADSCHCADAASCHAPLRIFSPGDYRAFCAEPACGRAMRASGITMDISPCASA